MPYADKADQREFQNEWIKERRQNFLADQKCAICGKTEDLAVRFPGGPLARHSHAIWSWSDERREVALAQAVVLCRRHAAQLSHLRAGRKVAGELAATKLRRLIHDYEPVDSHPGTTRSIPRNAKLSPEDVVAIRELRSKQPPVETNVISARFGIHRSHVWEIETGRLWREANGLVRTNEQERLVAFLYILMRDYVPVGGIATSIEHLSGTRSSTDMDIAAALNKRRKVKYSLPDLEALARQFAEQLSPDPARETPDAKPAKKPARKKAQASQVRSKSRSQ